VITWSFVFILVFAGGLVRTTGSGMGCPDWPKCFEQWVPPTNVSQLPENYREIHSNKREKKIERLSNFLESLGFNNKADQIRNDQTLLEEQEFNARKTWTEYGNRLMGALTGVFALLFAISSFQFWKSNRRKTWTALASLVAIGFNGWLGSLVVATNLLPGIVSLHFFLAFLAVALIMVATYTNFEMKLEHSHNSYRTVMIVGLFLTLVQILLGTLVREKIDELAKSGAQFVEAGALKETMIGTVLLFHKIWTWIMIAFAAALYAKISKDKGSRLLLNLQLIIGLIIFSQLITGALNLWFALPTVTQLIHVVFGSAIVGIQMYICISFFNRKKAVNPA
jgi:cytochrome c oxidase assembly protein subunit 15